MSNLGLERDYEERFDTSIQGIYLPGTSVEIIREPCSRGSYEHALFDFDGTLSLIREGWPSIMAGLMTEILLDTPDHETEEEINALVCDLISRTTGKQTIYQMIDLVSEVRTRNGNPLEPGEYKSAYLSRLMAHIDSRREALRTGQTPPREMLVDGAGELLSDLSARGVRLYLASGTDVCFVREEAELLGIAGYFGDQIHGALDDYRSYSKAMVINRILQDNDVDGKLLLGFGDGYVEIDNTKNVGGTAIGVATDESRRSGTPDPDKRHRLLGVGADVIMPDFADYSALTSYLFAV